MDMYLKEEINYLTDFFFSYRRRIIALNKSGLFDEAKLFEGFAIEICGLFFPGKSFSNLNSAKPNFPYFDLISNDEQIYVQVSTQRNCSAKINNTLNKIKNGTLLQSGKTKRLLFFLLEPCDTKTVRTRKVKGIKFTKTRDIICMDSIVNRIANDPSFCHALYDLIQSREEKVGSNDAKFSKAIQSSAIVVKSRVPNTINDVSHVDRSDLIKAIQSCSRRHILVVGGAGSGKSALIRDLLESEGMYLYVRGEQLTNGSKYSDIWDFDIEFVDKYLKGKRLNVFIDSLEYVVGCELSVDLLTVLLSFGNHVSNIKYYMTCRSNDLITLQHYLKIFDIAQFHVGLFNDNQIKQILEECPSLKGLPNSVRELLRVPFYADFYARHIDASANVDDESELRKEIFETAICIKGKCASFGIDFHDVTKTVVSIAKERSVNQTLYVSKLEYNEKIIRALLSSDVLLSSGDGIRFRFDIFEDIIFEKILDDLFRVHSTDYSNFFTELDSLGDSCYRRYNLWISNKLKNEDSQVLILGILLSGVNSKWIDQTMISLLLSDNSSLFFRSYFGQIDSTLREKLINLINTIAFNVDYDKDTFDEAPFLSLIPVGMARIVVINYLFDKHIKEGLVQDGDHIITLLLDGNRSTNADRDTKKRIVFLAEKILEQHLDRDVWCKKDSDLMTLLLNSRELSMEWLKTFIGTINNKNIKGKAFRDAFRKDLLSFHLERASFKGELNGLVSDLLFNTVIENVHDDGFYLRGSKYGLNELTDRVDLVRSTPFTSSCFTQIVNGDFFGGLKLYVRLTNHIADKIKNDCKVVCLDDVANNRKYEFVYFEDLFFAGWFDECNLPYLIQDMAFILMNSIKAIFNKLKSGSKKSVPKVANELKRFILQESNNVGPLSMLILVWQSIIDYCPNYADELITDYSLIVLDLHRYVKLLPNRKADYLKTVLAQSVGLPEFNNRYKSQDEPISLRELFFKGQIMSQSTYVIDYCYQKYVANDDALNAYRSLDIRKAKYSTVKEGIMVEGYSKETEQAEPPYEAANRFIAETLIKMQGKTDCVQEAEDACAFLSGLDLSIRSLFDDEIMMFYCYILANPSLNEKRREEICTILIQKYKQVLLAGQIPVFRHDYFLALLKQIDSLTNPKLVYQIAHLTLSFLLSPQDNTFIWDLQKSLGRYFGLNKTHRSRFCSAMIELSKQEKEKQLYNLTIARKICKNEDSNDQIYIPDAFIERAGYPLYTDQTDSIIERCLSGLETGYDADIQKYDIHTLIPSISLFDFSNEFFKELFKDIVFLVLDCESEDWHSRLISYKESYTVRDKCSELIKGEEYQDYVVDLFFDYLSNRAPKIESLKWICAVLVAFVPSFFDEKGDRTGYFLYLNKIERKIDRLAVDEWAKNELRVVFVFNHYDSTFGDWGKFDVSYSNFDIMRMNLYFGKYSYLHPQLFFASLRRLHYDKMLPRLIIPIEECLAKTPDSRRVLSDGNCRYIIRSIVFIAYAKYLIIIKQDKALRKAFESILMRMYENNDAIALPLLNNLRVC